MLYDVVYYSEFININVHSSNHNNKHTAYTFSVYEIQTT
jgi:hypothetical protein